MKLAFLVAGARSRHERLRLRGEGAEDFNNSLSEAKEHQSAIMTCTEVNFFGTSENLRERYDAYKWVFGGNLAHYGCVPGHVRMGTISEFAPRTSL